MYTKILKKYFYTKAILNLVLLTIYNFLLNFFRFDADTKFFQFLVFFLLRMVLPICLWTFVSFASSEIFRINFLNVHFNLFDIAPASSVIKHINFFSIGDLIFYLGGTLCSAIYLGIVVMAVILILFLTHELTITLCSTIKSKTKRLLNLQKKYYEEKYIDIEACTLDKAISNSKQKNKVMVRKV